MRIYATFALLIALGSCSSGQIRDAASDQSDKPAEAAATDQLQRVRQLVTEKDWPQSLSVARSIVEAKTFIELPPRLQYQVLSIAGQVAVDHGPPKLGYDYLGRAIVMPEAGYEDWFGRLRAADKLGDSIGVSSALTVLMRRWPERASQIAPQNIVRAVEAARHLRNGVALPLLQSLYDARWKPSRHIEPSGTWRDLALLLLEEQRVADAKQVVGRITDPYVLISMRADRRFDAVVGADASAFDIEMATEREYQALQADSDEMPNSLELKSAVIESLIHQQRYEAALAASDSILQDIRSTNFPERLFQDFVDKQSWFFNLRSTALERVGRWDEAVAQLRQASLLPEEGSSNVDQLINLADLYCSLGRPQDARHTLASLVSQTSPYGTMQSEAVRADAAYQLGDKDELDRSMRYLRTHRLDAPVAYEDALIAVDESNRAAGELIAQLTDATQRQTALLSVQDFALPPVTPRDAAFVAKRQAIIARRDVQDAIRRVGRIEKYKLEAE